MIKHKTGTFFVVNQTCCGECSVIIVMPNWKLLSEDMHLNSQTHLATLLSHIKDLLYAWLLFT